MTMPPLLPRDKCDFERVDALIAAGPEAALPILDELLGWLQDINWPIAGALAQFLVSVGEPLVLPLKNVLRSGDDMWIYWVLQYVVARLPVVLVQQLRVEIVDLANAAENDFVAFCLGCDHGLWEGQRLRQELENRIGSYESFAEELRGRLAALEVSRE